VGSNPTGGHGYLSVVSVVCCEVEISATSLYLVQSSPTDYGASLCDLGRNHVNEEALAQWGLLLQKKEEK
jgi:hypothetical protein